MEQIISSILFDGRFWIAITEKIGQDGIKCVGRHVFGPEPSNNDLVSYYLFIAHTVSCHESDERVRPCRIKSIKKQARTTRKSFTEFKTLQKQYCLGKKDENKNRARLEEHDLYLKRKEKRKEKQKGH